MNLKIIDSLFEHMKKLITILVFISLTLAIIYFIYWLIVSIKIPLPEAVNNLFLAPTNMINAQIPNFPNVKDVFLLLPIAISLIFIILTYLLNYILQFVELIHKNYLNFVDTYKTILEMKINTQLKQNFIKELNKSVFLATKLKIEAESPNSYLRNTLSKKNLTALENKITKEILEEIKDVSIIRKDFSEANAYFIAAIPQNTALFFTTFINKTVQIINENIKERVKINFYCAVDIFDTENEANYKLAELDKVINLKVPNKILVAPRFKTYYKELYPEYFTFSLLGEYNFSKNNYKSKCINIYTLHRK